MLPRISRRRPASRYGGADLDEIVREIRASHPNPFTKTGELTFLREVDKLKRELPALTESERMVRAMQLVALLGDGTPSWSRSALHSALGIPFASTNLRWKDGSANADPFAVGDPNFKGNEATFEWRFRGEMFGMPFGKTDQWINAFKDLRASAFRTADPARPLHLRRRVPFFSQALPQQSAFYMQVNQQLAQLVQSGARSKKDGHEPGGIRQSSMRQQGGP